MSTCLAVTTNRDSLTQNPKGADSRLLGAGLAWHHRHLTYTVNLPSPHAVHKEGLYFAVLPLRLSFVSLLRGFYFRIGLPSYSREPISGEPIRFPRTQSKTRFSTFNFLVVIARFPTLVTIIASNSTARTQETLDRAASPAPTFHGGFDNHVFNLPLCQMHSHR
jgi:hypothetical protein